jgi:hypothetical protein
VIEKLRDRILTPYLFIARANKIRHLNRQPTTFNQFLRKVFSGGEYPGDTNE